MSDPAAALKNARRRLSRIGGGRAAALSLLLACLALRVWDPPPIAELRDRAFDSFQALVPRATTALPVTIVDIDEKSLRAEGQWPWPRTRIADLIRKANELGAIAIGFDVVFAEPDRYSPGSLVQIVRDLDPVTRARIGKLPSNDEVLAAAFRSAHVVVGESGVQQAGSAASTARQVSLATIGQDPGPYLVSFPGILANVPVLDAAAAGRGLFTIRAERDGIVRRVPMVMRVGDAVLPSLSLEMLRVASGAGPIIVKADQAGVREVGVRGLEIPTDRHGQIWVHFSPHDPRRYVSAEDLLAGRAPRGKFDHKLVLIGTSAIGLLDRQTTPIDPTMPGVEIHAQILENALTGSWIVYPSYAIAVELVLSAFISIAIIALVPVFGATTVAVLGVAAATSLLALAWYLYLHSGMLLDVTWALVTTSTVYLVLVFTNYLREEAQRHRIRNAFRYYLAPAMVEELAKAPEKLVLGGEEREMTIMFSDVRGFTTISEAYRRDPKGLTLLMNRLLTPLSNAIVENRGTIDKYMGDAIMAFWNAPLNDPDHALNACEAALEMHKRLASLNLSRAAEAEASGQDAVPINIGVGVNTGTCVVGNMGSDLRFDYSVLGDIVNLTSRLEGQSKTYGVAIIAGAKTVQMAGERFATIELDWIRVKGKTEPETVYGIFGGPQIAASDDFRRVRDLSTQMLECYRRRDWQNAINSIGMAQDLAQRYHLGTFFQLYTSRIENYRSNPPSDDWDGVYVAHEK